MQIFSDKIFTLKKKSDVWLYDKEFIRFLQCLMGFLFPFVLRFCLRWKKPLNFSNKVIFGESFSVMTLYKKVYLETPGLSLKIILFNGNWCRKQNFKWKFSDDCLNMRLIGIFEEIVSK